MPSLPVQSSFVHKEIWFQNVKGKRRLSTSEQVITMQSLFNMVTLTTHITPTTHDGSPQPSFTEKTHMPTLYSLSLEICVELANISSLDKSALPLNRSSRPKLNNLLFQRIHAQQPIHQLLHQKMLTLINQKPQILLLAPDDQLSLHISSATRP